MNWVYPILQIPARLALRIYIKKLRTNLPEVFNMDGPLLLACNHPNSFLDAILLSAWFKRPIHSLARGDAFKNPMYARLMALLHMHPIYRTSEGPENLGHNYQTFEICKEVFKQNGIVLIFSEGLCINEWHLRSLKKGTARLAVSAWEAGIPLKVLPVGYNYHSFKSAEKIIHINFGEVIEQPADLTTLSEGKKLLQFNELLKEALQKLVYEIVPGETSAAKDKFKYEPSVVKKILLAVPALVGLIIHYPLYKLLDNFVKSKAAGSGHANSIFLGIAFFGYPLFLLLLNIILAFFVGWYSLLVWLILPFVAYALVQVKITKYYGE